MISLIRILGNDIPERHARGQTLKNLKFIVENEIDFSSFGFPCSKHYVVNRIVDTQERQEIESYLTDNGCSFRVIPIDWKNYDRLSGDEKWKYLTNVNGARNFCLDNLSDEITAPLDGNCFFTLTGFLKFQACLQYDRGYAVIMMCRALEYPTEETKPNWTETYRFNNRITYANTEPQIAFIKGYDVKYDENLPYSKASKLELLYRIGAKGVWDSWYPELVSRSLRNRSKHYGKFCCGGYCFRLPSGIPEADENNKVRSELRDRGLQQLVRNAEKFR